MNPKYWYALHRPRRKEWFQKERIITPQITYGCNMTLDERGFFHNAKVYSLLKKDTVNIDLKYFLAVLNSKLMWFYLKSSGDVLRGGYFTFTTNYLEPFHIPYPPSNEIENEIVAKVTLIMELTSKYHAHHEKFINRIVTNFNIEKISKN